MKIFRNIMKVFTLLFVCSNVAHAALDLEITGGTNAGRKIAIVDIKDSAQTGVDIASVVRADLTYSGTFSPLKDSGMFAKPSNLSEVNVGDFEMGTEAVVVGTIRPSLKKEKTYSLKVELILLSMGKAILRSTLNAEIPHSMLKGYAHEVSNFVYEKLTGIKGAFDTKITYVRYNPNSKHHYELWISDYDGANSKRLLISSQPFMSPSWSHDNSKIVYVSFENRKAEIFEIDIATKKRTKLTSFKGLNGNPVYSHDGTKIAMVLSKDGNPEIYVLNTQTKSLKRITNNRAIDTEPSWSHDDKSLYFVSDRFGRPQIYNVDLSSGKVEKVTSQSIANYTPKSFNNGQGLILINKGTNGFKVTRYDFDGGFYPLTMTHMDEAVTVSPNGAMIIYSTTHNNAKRLGLVSTDGRYNGYLPTGVGDVYAPSWSNYKK